ncbi:alkylglycerol monooxygenase-like [Lineus longissimus]|uniref:alkylglycerol monooxygenase-like n=1 Tax=Lineus longissimus TaxID=88925 RepID=UPI002B4D653F
MSLNGTLAGRVGEAVQNASGDSLSLVSVSLKSFLDNPIIRPLRLIFYFVTPNETTFKEQHEVPDYVTEVFPMFTLMILLELVICFIRGRRTLRINDSFSSVSAGLLSLLPPVLFKGVELTAYIWIHENFNYFHLPWDSPWTWIVAFLGVDMGYYWAHRMGHEVNLLWAAHQTHHSSEHYNLTTALRQSASQKYVSSMFYLPMAIFVPPSAYLVHSQFNLTYQFWVHTEVIDKLGPLEYILNTPSHHRVHHGRNKYCLDKNYAGTLIIWDRLFGTFQEETKEEVVYGLVHPHRNWDVFYTQVSHFLYIWKCFWRRKGWRNKLNTLFMGPGWAPGKPRFGCHEDIPEIEQAVKIYNKDLPIWCNVYVVIHFALALLAYIALLTMKKLVGPVVLFVSVMYVVFTLSVFGWLYEHKPHAPYFELLRCLIYVGADIYLTSSGVYDGASAMLMYLALGLRFIFLASGSIWLIHCYRDLTAKKKEA